VYYFLVALLEYTATTKVQFESRKVRENWVRKPYGWDGVELGKRVFIKVRSDRDTNGLTSGSPFKYQLTKTEARMNNPARKGALKVNSSDMGVTKREERGE
jgi:hypothetical protein